MFLVWVFIQRLRETNFQRLKRYRALVLFKDEKRILFQMPKFSSNYRLHSFFDVKFRIKVFYICMVIIKT